MLFGGGEESEGQEREDRVTVDEKLESIQRQLIYISITLVILIGLSWPL